MNKNAKDCAVICQKMSGTVPSHLQIWPKSIYLGHGQVAKLDQAKQGSLRFHRGVSICKDQVFSGQEPTPLLFDPPPFKQKEKEGKKTKTPFLVSIPACIDPCLVFLLGGSFQSINFPLKGSVHQNYPLRLKKNKVLLPLPSPPQKSR